MRNAAWFIIAACVIQILGYAYALPTHQGDPTWSAHAQFHHVMGWFWLTGLNIALIALAWVPMQRRERWSLWVLLLGLIVGQGAHFLVSLLVPAGRPPEWWYDYALGLQALIYAGGLFLAWREMPARTA